MSLDKNEIEKVVVKNIIGNYALQASDIGTVLEVTANVTLTGPALIGFYCTIIIKGNFTVTMGSGFTNFLGATQWRGDAAQCVVNADSAGRLLWSADGLV